MKLTAERLREQLLYDPLTGYFIWIDYPGMSPRRRCRLGCIAGSVHEEGRRSIRIDGTNHQASRLAWLYVTGRWPSSEIDHIDCDAGNNAFSNLREASRAQNMRNTRVQSRSKSGVKGVCWDKTRRKWMAHICVDGKWKNLGRFGTKNEAAAIYAKAAIDHFGEFARAA